MSEKLSLEQLRATSEYGELSPRQQTMIEEYLRTGNKIESIIRAYNCSRESAQHRSGSVFARRSIVACLAVANGGSPEKAAFNDALDKAIRNPKTTPSQINALKLLAKMRGYLPAESGSDAGTGGSSETDQRQKFAVGDIIVQDGKRYRVTTEEIS